MSFTGTPDEGSVALVSTSNTPKISGEEQIGQPQYFSGFSTAHVTDGRGDKKTFQLSTSVQSNGSKITATADAQYSSSVLAGAVVNWLKVGAYDRDFQAGISTVVSQQLNKGFVLKGFVNTVQFAKGFNSKPNVVAWISGIKLVNPSTWSIKVSATAITTGGFDISIDGPAQDIDALDVTWIAYPASRGHITSGELSFSSPVPVLETGDQVETFRSTRLESPPRILLGVSGFEIVNKNGKFDLEVTTSGVTPAQFNWKASVKDGAGSPKTLVSLTAAYVAVVDL
ncbi:hypothetical protein WOLCODRAFT_167658 [Wolfiporia cocos MD-104 SS10]|uniref:H-type lectin domain-containing protein n=1 Tax=Wolfiporia cocos (strain MD-104) TaxID=742152 RepID=A0A2H3JM93_WOLCO|nr:hypothetical protein WOLCODRAFT_167658 [Wolfiporia cocos MD-104 SS10]